ncbi:MAG: hypothetical protein WA755_03360 [Candidatus Acidiferrales bacterium]
MSQLLFRSVALLTHFFFTQHAANDYGKMTNVFHLNTVRSPIVNEFGHGFWLYRVGQEDDGCMPAVLLKKLQCLGFPLFGGRVSGENQVVAL